MGSKTLLGMIGVIFAAGKSSIFLATAIVSTLLKEKELRLQRWIHHTSDTSVWTVRKAYCTAATSSGTETGRASILKWPSVTSSLAAILAGTMELSLALEIRADWSMAVFTPITANVFTTMLKGEDICMLDFMTWYILQSLCILVVDVLPTLAWSQSQAECLS